MKEGGLRWTPNCQTWGHVCPLHFDKPMRKLKNEKSNFKLFLALSPCWILQICCSQRALCWWSNKAHSRMKSNAVWLGGTSPKANGAPLLHYLIPLLNHCTLRTGLGLGSTGHTPGPGRAEVCLEKRGPLPRQASPMPGRPANELLLAVPSSESSTSQGPFI